ncbi:MAG TPA: hypothetical protein VLK32_00290 [Bacillota bacterium]|nr:hypothetical protein [Bacillota bacterium]
MSTLYEFSLTGHESFAFWPTVWSHGWCELPPFAVSPGDQTLERILELPDGIPVRLLLKGNNNEVEVAVETRRTLSEGDLKFIGITVRHILAMDADLSSLHELVKAEPEFHWIATTKAGRLLRSPTVFEDLVKTLCTTNTTWKQTRNMVRRLCESLGISFAEHRNTFPGPSAIAGSSEDVLKAAGLGYRAPYLLNLAICAANGELDVEGWGHSDVSSEKLARAMARVRGIGPYASANMLRVLGRTDHLYVENWMIRNFSIKRNGGKPATSSDLGQYYSRFGAWRGIMLWLDTTNMPPTGSD